ncbi:MAG TPA: LLM class flavin-dependent oxidoreductase [Gaiellales bacterium]|jgi:alkanesulfonate monooxygenase SsuD/methylene tetrahydromethanopterin reductase-like flavin-dependent oxidoreductase (luciferase family)
MPSAASPYAHPIGVSLGDMVPPERIGARARELERLGYSHLMIPEDYFYVPALVGATLALGATESVPVGTSIVSGMVRHPAVLAMEIAGISRTFPGRFRPGIGLGLPEWLRQMGFMPDKPVAALRESVGSIRRLLAGETVTLEGTHFSLDQIGITHPAIEHVPIAMGVSGPMLLRLAGELADTTLFAASAGVEYFRFGRERVRSGLSRAGRPDDAMAYSTIALTCVNRDGAAARAALRPMLGGFLAEFGVNTMTDAYGISAELGALIERGGEEAVTAGMPDEWLEDLTLTGTPAEVVRKMRAWLGAGLDSICIFNPDAELEERTVALVAESVIPAL